ncbi:MAG: hypothetical protein OHK0039_06110 [Bacteroidia bacterium]
MTLTTPAARLPLIWGLTTLLGLLLRLGYLAWLGPEALLDGDAGAYTAAATALLAGEAYAAYWPPGLPYLLAGAAWLLTAPAGYFAVGLAGYLAMAALLAQIVRDARSAWATGLVLAVYPTLLHHSIAPLSQVPVAAGVLGLLLLTARQIPHRLLAAGLLLGLMALVRPATLVLPGALALWLLAGGQRRYLYLALLLLGCALPVAGWQVHMRASGAFINYANARNLYLGNHPQTPHYRTWWLGSHDVAGDPAFADFVREQEALLQQPVAARDRAYRALAQAHIAAAPATFVRRSLNRFRCFWAFDSFAGAFVYAHAPRAGLVLVALDGLIYVSLGWLALLTLLRQPLRAHLRELLLLGGLALPYVLAFAHPTYHLPAVGILLVLAATTIRQATRWHDLLPRSPREVLILLAFAAIQAEWVWQRWGDVG